MKIKRLKPNLTEVTASSGIVVLFSGSMAVAASSVPFEHINEIEVTA
jgi:hypothetical protein